MSKSPLKSMLRYALPFWLLLACCAVAHNTHAQQLTSLQLNAAQKQLIGQRIWQNEGLGKIQNLTVWNKGEDFPSFGIGHFIWYPPNVEHTFTESFPQFLNYANSNGTPLPSWLKDAVINPWSNRQQFYNEINSPKMTALREFLVGSFDLQVGFILARMNKALPRILATLSHKEQTIIQQRFETITQTPAGVFALIDYINFKGEGISEKERYQGQGWGLLQVLQNIDPNNPDLLSAFVHAADKVLTRRVHNAPRDESIWLKGWRNRLQGYLEPF